MLRQEPGLEIWTCEPDESRALERVKELRPDVVIIEHRKPATNLGNTLRRMLQACKRLKIIELDPDDETICIYSSHQQLVKQVQDLVEAIER